MNGFTKAVIADRDGTFYDAETYADGFMHFLAVNYIGASMHHVMQRYQDFKHTKVIGESYSIKTGKPYSRGKRLNHSFSVPALVSLTFGMTPEEYAEAYTRYERKIAYDPELDADKKLVNQFKMLANGYKAALVTGTNSPQLLQNIGISNVFDLQFCGPEKFSQEGLEQICEDIEAAWHMEPAQMLWLEDNVAVLERVKARGYQTALRKTHGFVYPPERELSRFADVIFEKDSQPVIDYLRGQIA